MHKLSIFTLIIILFSLFSCSKKNYDNHDHNELKTGKEFYSFHCAQCHRESGRGQVMKGIPPIIYSKLTHSQIRKLIIIGHKNSKMAVFKTMPKEEARKIARYINKLSQADIVK
ncbi:MAG: cytochrome c [Pseudomonadota bacterium]